MATNIKQAGNVQSIPNTFELSSLKIHESRQKDGTLSEVITDKELSEKIKKKRGKLLSTRESYLLQKSNFTKNDLSKKFGAYWDSLSPKQKIDVLKKLTKFFGDTPGKNAGLVASDDDSPSGSPSNSLVKRSGGNIFYIIGKFLKGDIDGNQDEMISALKQVAAQRNMYSMMNQGLQNTENDIKTQTDKSVSEAEKYQHAKHRPWYDKVGDFFKHMFTNPISLITMIAVVVITVAVGVLTMGAGDAALAPADSAILSAEAGAEGAAAGGTGAAASGSGAAAATGDATGAAGEASGDAAGDTAGSSGADDGTSAADDAANDEPVSDEVPADEDVPDTGDTDATGEDGQVDDADGQSSSTERAEDAEAEEEQSTSKLKRALQKAREKWACFKNSNLYRFGVRPVGLGLAAGSVATMATGGLSSGLSSIEADPNFIRAQGALKKDQVQTEVIGNKIQNINNNIDQSEQTDINNPNQQLQTEANQVSSMISKMVQVESIGQM